MKLYHLQGSPFGWMARTAVAEKGLEVEMVEPKDRATNPELRKLNPLNRTPTLVDEGKVVYESWALLEYLDEKYPDPPLMPKDPAARARARAMALLGYLYIFQDNRQAVLQLFEWDKWEAGMLYPPRRPADQVDRSIVGPAEERLMGHYRILDAELAESPGDGLSVRQRRHRPHDRRRGLSLARWADRGVPARREVARHVPRASQREGQRHAAREGGKTGLASSRRGFSLPARGAGGTFAAG